jgi:hypothetical protein
MDPKIYPKLNEAIYGVYCQNKKNFVFKLKFEFYYGYKMNQVALNTLKLLARFSISKHHPWQLSQNTLYDLS